MKTTIDPGLQEAAVSALAGRAGGVAVLDARRRRRPRPRRPGLLRPPAARLDLQDDHHDRRPGEGPRLARRRIRNHQRRQRRRPLHQQRQRRVLRRHLPRGLRRVLQRRLRPARARRSATTSWSRPRKRFGFNSPPTLYAPQIVARSRTGRIDDPDRNRRRSRPRRHARSARAKCWRRRWRWRASPRRSPTTASASRPRSSPTRSCGPTPKPVRVMSKKIADELTELMIGVVTEGTGYRRGDPRGPGRRQDRHRRARARSPGEENARKPDADQGRLVRRLRPGRKGEAGGRGAADRSRSGGRRSRRADAAEVLSAGL